MLRRSAFAIRSITFYGQIIKMISRKCSADSRAKANDFFSGCKVRNLDQFEGAIFRNSFSYFWLTVKRYFRCYDDAKIENVQIRSAIKMKQLFLYGRRGKNDRHVVGGCLIGVKY